MKLSRRFYTRSDVLLIARSLLGKCLCSFFEGTTTKGMIVETEAYDGLRDKACHSYKGKRTKRTETMYRQGGVAYVYLCYGLHHLFNVVTNKEGRADAVLVRAIEPLDGVKTMLGRRKMEKVVPALTAGPARVSMALGITTRHNGRNLLGGEIWIEHGRVISSKEIQSSPRVGVAYAGEDAALPWRFFLKDNPWVSCS